MSTYDGAVFDQTDLSGTWTLDTYLSDSPEQVAVACAAGTDLVLLDNMTPDLVADCVKLVDGRCLVEVSGGITLTTVGEYADAGPDLISVGTITHSAPIVDIGLDLPDLQG